MKFTKIKVNEKNLLTECFISGVFSFSGNLDLLPSHQKNTTPILIATTGHSKESLFLTYFNKREDKDANADSFMNFYEAISKDIEAKAKDKPAQMNVV